MRADVSEALSTCKLCVLFHHTNNVSVCLSVLLCDPWRLWRTRSWNCHQCRCSAVELPLPHLLIDHSIRRMYGILLCEWEREPESGWGGGREGREGGRQRDCSVVVYVSLRSCVGRSVPSRHCCCCCCKKTGQRTPHAMDPLYLCRLTVLWSHPDGMLLKLTTLRITAGVNWAGTQWQRQEENRIANWGIIQSRFHFWSSFLGLICLLFRRVATADKVSIPSVEVWRGHRWGLFVEGVAVDTDGRQAALEPEARVNKSPAAECACWSRCGWTELSNEIHAALSVKATSSAKEQAPNYCSPRALSVSCRTSCRSWWKWRV